jgi:hypothetical protein
MRVINAELLRERRGSVKFLLNDSVIAFFLVAQQHRDVKWETLSYEDDYRGNALAGLVTPERVEIRFHSAFSDERLKILWLRVLTLPEIAAAKLGKLYYQGRDIT